MRQDQDEGLRGQRSIREPLPRARKLTRRPGAAKKPPALPRHRHPPGSEERRDQHHQRYRNDVCRHQPLETMADPKTLLSETIRQPLFLGAILPDGRIQTLACLPSDQQWEPGASACAADDHPFRKAGRAGNFIAVVRSVQAAAVAAPTSHDPGGAYRTRRGNVDFVLSYRSGVG